MTTEVTRAIDPDIAAALGSSPLGAIDFGTYTFDDLPAVRAAMAGVAPALLPTTTVTREVAIPGVGHDLRALAGACSQLVSDAGGQAVTAELIGQYFGGR